ncbi:MAG TPA: AAA family ATPase [Tepidisphaeraceae bacterium]|nr:AAA family ATPase [Tepidisphaeraceae bacterium]
MLRRITLENFMSHAHTVIDLAEGLTVLVGPNNCGKSAVIEALRTVCTNLPAEMLVRHGQREARITVETDDNHTIVWRRKGATVSYIIDGREVHRLKGSVPDDLHQLLRLPKVTTPQGDSFDIHFALQKSPMFLIDESGSKAAGFFSTSSDAEKLMQMQQRHREKVRNAKARHKDLTAEIERLAAQVQTLAPVDELATRVEQVEQEHAAIVEENQQLASFTALLRQLDEQVAIHDRHAACCQALSTLSTPPVLEDAPSLDRLLAQLTLTQQLAHRESVVGQTLAALTPPPTLDDTSPLQSLASTLDRAHRAVEYLAARATAVADLQKPPTLEDEFPLTALCDRLAQVQHQTQRLAMMVDSLSTLRESPAIDDLASLQSSIRAFYAASLAQLTACAHHAALAVLQPPPDQPDTTPLQMLIDQWTENRRQATQHAVDICELDLQLAQIEQQIHTWASAHPVCPVCGAAVDPARILAQEHAHAR